MSDLRTDYDKGYESATAFYREKIEANLVEIGQKTAALESIAANTCCDTCQEAALVAKQALNPVADAQRPPHADVITVDDDMTIRTVLDDPAADKQREPESK